MTCADLQKGTAQRPQSLGEALTDSFAKALVSPEGTADAVALLWTDPDGQWRELVPKLRTVFPNLFVLGPYALSEKTGPAIWLRCVVDRAIPELVPPDGEVPILYLPGVARQILRSASDCPSKLQPLIELQYRGRVWHQRNGRDWTIEALFVSEDGLAMDLAQDALTREALHRALPLLADVPLDSLRGKRLEAEDFDRLAVPDPIRDLLHWLGAPEEFRKAGNDGRWKTFCSVSKAELDFDPDKKSPLDAAGDMIDGRGRWAEVWQRFCEAPRLYPGVSKALKGVPGFLFNRERSPLANDNAEIQLRKELDEIPSLPHHAACEKILRLDADHSERRHWVWAQLGESPLALALAPLARLAELAKAPFGGTTIEAMVKNYASDGWRCDQAALESLALTQKHSDTTLIRGVVRALYLPWLDASARHFQELVSADEAAVRTMVKGTPIEKDTCVVFADGLRFDVAGMLHERLEAREFRVQMTHHLAPLPTITATAKPVSSLARDAVEGVGEMEDFVPAIRSSGKPATVVRLREEMSSRAVDVLSTEEMRAPSTNAACGWIEAGRFDNLGHKLGVELALHVERELGALVDLIVALFEVGWSRIRVVTDHGWLLLPGGLPKVDLPSHLVATKWSRCAAVRGDSRPAAPLYGWYWNPQSRIASPPGATSFYAGAEYAHGGVSLQECVVPDLIVERGEAAASATITKITWKRMWCRVTIKTNNPTVRVDLRLNWKQATTSIAASVKEVGQDGETNLAVDDLHEGSAATVVVLDDAGNVLDRKTTTVGEST